MKVLIYEGLLRDLREGDTSQVKVIDIQKKEDLFGVNLLQILEPLSLLNLSKEDRLILRKEIILRIRSRLGPIG